MPQRRIRQESEGSGLISLKRCSDNSLSFFDSFTKRSSLSESRRSRADPILTGPSEEAIDLWGEEASAALELSTGRLCASDRDNGMVGIFSQFERTVSELPLVSGHQ